MKARGTLNSIVHFSFGAFFFGVFFSLFFFPAELNGQVLHLTQSDTVYQLEDYFTYAQIDQADESAAIQIAQSELQPLSKQSPPFSDGKNHWLKIELLNEVPDNFEWVFHFSLIPTEIEYYSFVGNRDVIKGKTGFFTPPAERSFKPRMKGNYCKLALPPGEKVTVLFRIRSDRIGMGPKFETTLSGATFFYDDLKTYKQNNGLYVGFILLIFIYNLFLFFLARDKAYIYYSTYLFTLTFFTVYNTGDLADWLTETLYPTMPQRLAYFKLSTYFIIISYLAFLRYFLEMKKTFPKWNQFFQWVSIGSLVALVVDAILITTTNYNYTSADIVTVGYTVVFLIATTAFLFPLSKSTDYKKYFIIGGFAAMGIGAVFTIINRYQTVDFSTLPFRLGTVIEVIIFSLGLAYRQREAERQKQEAHFELERSKIHQEQKEKEAARLEDLAENKNRFYTNIAHEFRTPLTVIMGVSKQLENDQINRDLSPSQKLPIKEGHALIQRNGEQLLQQINQLLDLSKLDSKTLKVDYTQTDVVPYLSYLTESFSSISQSKNINLLFESEVSSLLMDIDESKLQMILNNLLSNALKFTAEGGEVKLLLRKTERSESSWLKLEVIDNGIGIAAHELPQVFDRYFQSDSISKGGSGIGLALTKELVELLEGSISVVSEKAKGTTFAIYLPIKNEAPLTASISSKNQPTRENQTQPIALPKAEEENNVHPTLLVIEDNQDVSLYIERLLKNDYQLEFAKDGKEGVEKATESIPDIIISDVMMPEMDGIELCKILKQDERTSHVPIILLTAKATEADRLTGLDAGADAYLVKPFNQEELFVRLKRLHELRQVLQSRYSNFKDEAKLPSPPKPLGIEDAFLKRLSSAVEEKLEDVDFGVPQLCRIAGMSNTQLNRKLKALTGGTPSRFIRNVRLKKAKLLLENSQMNISEVAYKVGFNDPNYFTRLFSEAFGQPPSKFRN